MGMDALGERAYFQVRVRHELARSRRFGRPFVIVAVEAHRGTDVIPLQQRLTLGLEVLRGTLRDYNLAYKVFEVAAVLLETDHLGARSAPQRLNQRLALRAGRGAFRCIRFRARKGGSSVCQHSWLLRALWSRACSAGTRSTSHRGAGFSLESRAHRCGAIRKGFRDQRSDEIPAV